MKTLLDDRRLLLPLLLTAVVIAVGSVLVVMLSDDASGSASAPPSSAPAAPGTVTIDIVDFEYKPVQVTVKAGTKVSWANQDTAPHTATASGAGDFDTGTLNKGDSKAVRLAKPGTHAYICSIHPFMKATVTVK